MNPNIILVLMNAINLALFAFMQIVRLVMTPEIGMVRTINLLRVVLSLALSGVITAETLGYLSL